MIGQRPTVRIGADVGGTFTDVLAIDSTGQIWSHKVPSTPPHFERAVLNAVGHLLQAAGIASSAVTEVAHGTTVATNAVLERLGARTALVTTKGFRDVLELRRLRVPQLYNLFFEKPRSLIERELRLEVLERVAADGTVLIPLTDDALWNVKTQLEALDVEAVAVSLLHSYANPDHEERTGAFLRDHLPGVLVSLSCDVLRERREYERTATTAVNCYVLPIVKQYLSALRRGLEKIDIRAPLHVMQSSGGLAPESDASQRPVYILESGPAAGVLAARYLGRRLGIGNIISFDMGGTTAKASMIEAGQIAYSPEYEVGSSLSRSNRLVGGAGELVRVPTIDIAETGAGGGSIAWLDRAGSLHVGPRSAGAVPGPACYQRGGTEPTLTDANVVLGYIRPGKLANGDVSIDYGAAERAISDKVAKPLALDLLGAAEGIHRIANALTMRALREVSTQRGRDPRDYVLVAFGGMGPIHAAGLGLELQVPRIIIPPLPGLFSAAGLLFSDIEHHDVRSCRLSGPTLNADALRAIKSELERAMVPRFAAEGFVREQINLQYSVDLRYQGQFSEIRVPLAEPVDDTTVQKLLADYLKEHQALYGHVGEHRTAIEAVNMRLIGRIASPAEHSVLRPAEDLYERAKSRKAYFGCEYGMMPTPVMCRHELLEPIAGPLLIDEYDSTIVVPPRMIAQRDEHFNIVLERADG